ncbi:MAG TPA: anti-sigma factor [Terriglobales bacterium]|nr:anti-sigma factor [Terriglobales bacterium]
MTAHEQFAEDLALYALGSLEGEPAVPLERHLDECAACRQELARLEGDMALLALTTSGPAPPQRARQRLLKAMGREPRSLRTVFMRRRWWTLAPVFASLVLAIFAILLWRENASQRDRIVALRADAARNQATFEEARHLLVLLTDPSAMHVTLVAAQSKPQPAGKAIYTPTNGALVFMASNLAPLAPAKTYELWLVPMRGDKPMPAGTFKPDQKGNAVVMMPPLSPGVEAKTFAVTIEPEGGSATPTMPLVLVGS